MYRVHSLIDRFTNKSKWVDVSFPWDLVTSYSINLLWMNELQYLESSLHILRVPMSAKPRESYQVVENNLLSKVCRQFEYVRQFYG